MLRRPHPTENVIDVAARFSDRAREAAASGDPAAARRIQTMMLGLARLAQPHIPPPLWAALDQAERYMAGQLTDSEAFEALQDTWGYVTGLACGVGPSDGGAAQIVMACLERNAASQTETHLTEQVLRVLGAGVPEETVRELLENYDRPHPLIKTSA